MPQKSIFCWIRVQQARKLVPLSEASNANSIACPQVFDIETGVDREVLNLNPDGWIQGVSNEKNWLMLYGLDVCHDKQLITGGDSKGMLYFVDPRTSKRIATHQVHKKGNKVTPQTHQTSALHCCALSSRIPLTPSLRFSCQEIRVSLWPAVSSLVILSTLTLGFSCETPKGRSCMPAVLVGLIHSPVNLLTVATGFQSWALSFPACSQQLIHDRQRKKWYHCFWRLSQLPLLLTSVSTTCR